MHGQMIRSAVFIASIAGLYLSAAMLVPAAVDFYYANRDWQVFTISAFVVGTVCLAAAMATRGASANFSRRLGFLVVNLLWITLSVAGAIPLYMSSLGHIGKTLCPLRRVRAGFLCHLYRPDLRLRRSLRGVWHERLRRHQPRHDHHGDGRLFHP